jgi:DNA replication and repair protein RecF
MICKAVRAGGFRNIGKCEVPFTEGVNLLFGANAQGKTNLLEAIGFFSMGKSFRGVRDTECIGFSEQEAVLSLDFRDSQRDQNLTVCISRTAPRKTTQNGVKVTRIADMIGQFRAVLFFPEHLNIIKEGPSMRRSYMDVAISQLRPLYLRSLQRYNHVLQQRNRLIKNARDDRAAFDRTVEFWSYQLAREAAFVTRSRLGYLSLVSEELSRCFSEMTGGSEKPALSYDFSFRISGDDALRTERYEELFMAQLMDNHDREIAAGATLWGVHKDDIDITLNGKSARFFASQGQQRSLALGLKLAESAISEADTGERPVLLLDDVFSELDAARREYLTGRMTKGQVIMSSCGDVDLGAVGVNVIAVENGRYTCSST